jgi:hypothetical protein
MSVTYITEVQISNIEQGVAFLIEMLLFISSSSYKYSTVKTIPACPYSFTAFRDNVLNVFQRSDNRCSCSQYGGPGVKSRLVVWIPRLIFFLAPTRQM